MCQYNQKVLVNFHDNLTFPAADRGANQFLKTDGSGNLSFDAAGGSKTQVVTAQKTDTFLHQAPQIQL